MAGTAIEVSLWSNLGGPLRRSSVKTLPNTDTVRTEATITSELSLFSKFGRVTAMEFGRGATVGGDPDACQGDKR